MSKKSQNNEFSLRNYDIEDNKNLDQNEKIIQENNNVTSENKELKNDKKNIQKIRNDIKKDENKNLKRNFLIGFVVSFFIIGLLCLVIFFIEFYATRVGMNINAILSDTFLVPSLLAILVYLLNVVTNEGAFDALAYGIKLAFYNTFYTNVRKTKLPASYREYRELKRGKKRTSLLYIVLAAIPYIIIGLAYYIMFAVSI